MKSGTIEFSSFYRLDRCFALHWYFECMYSTHDSPSKQYPRSQSMTARRLLVTEDRPQRLIFKSFVDSIWRRLYGWCFRNPVPITRTPFLPPNPHPLLATSESCDSVSRSFLYDSVLPLLCIGIERVQNIAAVFGINEGGLGLYNMYIPLRLVVKCGRVAVRS